MKKLINNISYDLIKSSLDDQILFERMRKSPKINILLYSDNYLLYGPDKLEKLINFLLEKEIFQTYFLGKNAEKMGDLFDQIAVKKYVSEKNSKYLDIYTTSKADKKFYIGDITAFLLTKSPSHYDNFIIYDHDNFISEFSEFEKIK